MISYAQTHGVNNRIAAYMLAIDRVALYDQAARNVCVRGRYQVLGTKGARASN